MPDLVSHCTFDLRVHEELPRAVWECKAWMIDGSNISRNEKTLNSLHGLKAGGQFTISLYLLISPGRTPRADLRMLPVGTPSQTEGLL